MTSRPFPRRVRPAARAPRPLSDAELHTATCAMADLSLVEGPAAADADPRTAAIADVLGRPDALTTVLVALSSPSRARVVLPTTLLARVVALLEERPPDWPDREYALYVAGLGDPATHTTLVAPVFTAVLDPAGAGAQWPPETLRVCRRTAARASVRYTGLSAVLRPWLLTHLAATGSARDAFDDRWALLEGLAKHLDGATKAEVAEARSLLRAFLEADDVPMLHAEAAAACGACYGDPRFEAAVAAHAAVYGPVAAQAAAHLSAEQCQSLLPEWIAIVTAWSINEGRVGGALAALHTLVARTDVTCAPMALLPLLESTQPAAVREVGALLASRAVASDPLASPVPARRAARRP